MLVLYHKVSGTCDSCNSEHTHSTPPKWSAWLLQLGWLLGLGDSFDRSDNFSLNFCSFLLRNLRCFFWSFCHNLRLYFSDFSLNFDFLFSCSLFYFVLLCFRSCVDFDGLWLFVENRVVSFFNQPTHTFLNGLVKGRVLCQNKSLDIWVSTDLVG